MSSRATHHRVARNVTREQWIERACPYRRTLVLSVPRKSSDIHRANVKALLYTFLTLVWFWINMTGNRYFGRSH